MNGNKTSSIKPSNPKPQAVTHKGAKSPRKEADQNPSEVELAITEILRLTKAMAEGKLGERGDPSCYSGTSAELIVAVNSMLDSLVNPLRMTANLIDQIAHGKIPDFIVEEYVGEYNDIKRNLNKFLAVLYGMHHEMQNLIRAVKEGKLQTRGNDWDYDGNWETLVKGINEILDATIEPVHDANDVLKKLAEYDLTVRMNGKYRGEHAQIKRALNTSVQSLHAAFSKVAASIEHVAKVGEQIAASNEEVAAGAVEQSSLLRSSSDNLNQISARTKLTSENAQQSRKISLEAKAAVDKGNEAMNLLRTAMTDILQTSEGTKVILQEINAVTAQTDTLTKNASTEAGKVGSSARGFAVVAGEVRKLSLRCKELANLLEEDFSSVASNNDTLSSDNLVKITTLTKEMNKIAFESNFLAINAAVEAAHVDSAGVGFEDLTKNIQNLAEQSHSSASKTDVLIQSSIQRVKEGENLTNSVYNALLEIVESFNSVSKFIDWIAQASQEQVSDVDVIKQVVSEATLLSDSYSQITEVSAESAIQLAHETTQLSQTIEKFKLKGE
ncbi:MAG: methyl-accepting chemotaxis protein [bacterium]|nr:methyl-accepting chemotaxis protein [bacterium]